jgi:hypothetical protein
MAARRSNGVADGGVARVPPGADRSGDRAAERVADRVTVALIPKAAEDLQLLQDRTGLSKTDLVNRAITLYEFIESQGRGGRDLLIKDRATGETQTVLIL